MSDTPKEETLQELYDSMRDGREFTQEEKDTYRAQAAEALMGVSYDTGDPHANVEALMALIEGIVSLFDMIGQLVIHSLLPQEVKAQIAEEFATMATQQIYLGMQPFDDATSAALMLRALGVIEDIALSSGMSDTEWSEVVQGMMNR